jgi:hypothetical protein
VLSAILLGGIEALCPIAGGPEHGSIGPHLLDVADGKAIVLQELTVALEGSFYGLVL